MEQAMGYEFVQTVPATTWTIKHNRSCQPIVHVYINVEGNLERMLPKSIEATSLQTIEITFSTPQIGQVVLK